MRLKSNRWYSSDGQHQSRGRVAQNVAGSRRVVSLCLLLALIIVLMQKASDPRHVSNAFQALGVPLEDEAKQSTDRVISAADRAKDHIDGATQNSSAEEAGLGTAVAASQTLNDTSAMSWEALCNDLVPRLLDEATDQEIDQLGLVWFSRPFQNEDDHSAPSTAAATSTADTPWPPTAGSRAQLDTLVQTLSDQTTQSSLSTAEIALWLSRLTEFREQWLALIGADSRGQLPAMVRPELRTAITAELDRRLFAKLRDAAPWTRSETVAFWRMLQRATSAKDSSRLSDSPIPTVNTLQLASEPNLLRGQPLRFRGSVRRVERVTRDYPPLKMAGGYWVVWLRGEDESVQPVAVYTTDKLAGQWQRQIDDRTIDFPQAEVHGFFGKRLAYAAQSGVQVAPALFATSLTNLTPPAPPFEVQNTEALWGQLRIALLLGAAIAAAILLPILWQRRSAGGDRRPRPRSTGRPPAGNNSSAGRGLMLLATLVTYSATLASPAAWSRADEAGQTAPPAAGAVPWASTATPLWEQALSISLQGKLEAGDVLALRSYAADRSGSFPTPLLRIIHTLRKIGWAQVLQMTDSLPLTDELSLRRHRLSGWVRLAMPVALDDTQRSWFQTYDQQQLVRIELQQQDDLYEAPLQPQNLPLPVQPSSLLSVYCERVPQIWLTTAQLRQPIQIEVLVLQDSRQPQPLCALALAPKWLLPFEWPLSELAAQLAPPLPSHYLELGQLGWDLANIELVAALNQKPLSGLEASAFYSLLRLSSDAGGSATSSAETWDQPLQILSQSSQSVGMPLRWRVRIVSGTVVKVEDAAHQEQLGSDRYVQFDGFVDIGTDRIRIRANETQPPSDAIEFQGEFPVTIVSRIDSPFTPQQLLAAGVQSWPVGKYAEVQGRFYRMWSYQSERLSSSGQNAQQLAPLVIAAQLATTTLPVRGQPTVIGWFGWAMCGSTLVILAGIMWSVLKRDARRIRHR